MKKLLNFLIVFITLIALFSCQDDEFLDHSIEKNKVDPVFTTELLSGNEIPKLVELRNAKQLVKKHLNTNLAKKSRTYDSINEIWIDDSKVQYVKSGEYESYTYAVIDPTNPSKLKNLLLQKQIDSTYLPVLLTYDIDSTDFSNSSIEYEVLNSSALNNNESSDVIEFLISIGDLNSCNNVTFLGGSGCACWTLTDNVISIDVLEDNCTIFTSDPAEEIDDTLTESGSSGGGGNNTSTDDTSPDGQTGGGFNTGGGDDNDSSTGPTSGSSGQQDEDPDNDQNNTQEQDDCLTLSNGDCSKGGATVLVIPEDDLNREKECKKITDFLSSNPAFKTKLQNLASDSNLNLPTEKGAGKIENQTTIEDYQGNSSIPEIEINIPDNKFEALAHNHPLTNQFSLSTFSPNDLISIAKLIKANKITNKFVAFLSTKQGTHYAISISNPTKFLDFFFYKTFKGIIDVPFSDYNRYLDSKDEFTPLYDKYFNPDKNPKIKASDPNDPDINEQNEEDLEQFLRFMKKADAGFNLFETNNTFNTFNKLKLKNGNPEREIPCN